MKHTIVRGLVVPFVLAAVFGGSPRAMADSTIGLTVGPASQSVDGGTLVNIYVSNPTDTPIVVKSEASPGVIITKEYASLHIRPHRQVTVSVFVNKVAGAPCEHRWIGFYVNTKKSSQVVGQPAVQSQIYVKGANGSDKDCIKLLPEYVPPPATPTHGGINPWFWFLLLLVILFLVGYAWREQRKSTPKKKGSSYGF